VMARAAIDAVDAVCVSFTYAGTTGL